ncbi:MAG: hypothetical protein J5720_08915 [Bacteroidaceae bacterium]|nr:hypothetical protein [Bacteroidaceae bacterium]
MTNYYTVAGHIFSVCGEEEIFSRMDNYAPFSSGAAETVVFSLSVEGGEPPAYVEEIRQDDEGQVIICGRTPAGEPVFEYRWGGKSAGWLICSADYVRSRLVVTDGYQKLAVDNALMVLYALATARLQTALFHAAAVSYKDCAYMFLGKSGTGKSTHARLWQQYIEGVELVNDDNPVVRIMDDGQAWVFGSPWSGKTPCYRPVSYPLKGIVLLSQAPYNKIERLRGIQAYAALVPSISGKRWDERIADGLHQTENTLASHVPVWHLECLPDEAAARICNETISA